MVPTVPAESQKSDFFTLWWIMLTPFMRDILWKSRGEVRRLCLQGCNPRNIHTAKQGEMRFWFPSPVFGSVVNTGIIEKRCEGLEIKHRGCIHLVWINVLDMFPLIDHITLDLPNNSHAGVMTLELTKEAGGKDYVRHVIPEKEARG